MGDWTTSDALLNLWAYLLGVWSPRCGGPSPVVAVAMVAVMVVVLPRALSVVTECDFNSPLLGD